MVAFEKNIDRDFLNNYYKEMVDEIGDIFQLFIEEIPYDIKRVKQGLTSGNYNEASEILHKIAPSFYNIGLPVLTAKIQPIESFIEQNNFTKALNEIILFEEDLNSYMPAVIMECERLKALQTD